MSRRLPALALLAALTVLAGCGRGEPSAAQRQSGKQWLAQHGADWRKQAATWGGDAQRIMGTTGFDPGTEGLAAWCRRAGRPAAPRPPFPVDAVRAAQVEASDRLRTALQTCARPDLSLARQEAHQVIDQFSNIDRLLEQYP